MLVIPGTSSTAHLEENIAAAELRLTPEDLRELGSVLTSAPAPLTLYPCASESDALTVYRAGRETIMNDSSTAGFVRVGGRLVIDLLNTVSARDGVPVDLLDNPEDLPMWADVAGVPYAGDIGIRSESGAHRAARVP